MAGVPTSSRRGRTVGSESDASVLHDLTVQHNAVIDDLETVFRAVPNQVMNNTGAGLSVDANAQDIEMDNAIAIRWNGMEFPVAQEDPIDVSTKTINGRTIATSRADAGWVFAKYDGTIDMDQSIAAQTLATTAISGLSRYSMATTTLPPAAGYVPIGVVSLLEGGSGLFTWGAESITAETEVYYSFRGVPGVVEVAASFAATGGAAATFAYGAGACRLGTGTIVSYTGKTGVAFDALHKTSVPTGSTGVWFLYVLADDSEIAAQYGGAGYASIELARAAVRAHNPNPLLPIVGIIYIENESGSDFVPATTNLNVAGLTCTFEVVPVGTNFLFGGASDLTAVKIGDSDGVAIAASS